MRDAVFVILAAALVMSPGYLASIVLHRLNLDIALVVIISLALFLSGIFLLLRVLKD